MNPLSVPGLKRDSAGHLWAVAYDDMERADQVREQIARLGWGAGKAGRYLVLLDAAVAVRHPDGSFTLDQKPLPCLPSIAAFSVIGFFIGLALAVPLTGAAAGALLGGAGVVLVAVSSGIRDDFVREVEGLMKPGTSVLLVRDFDADMEVTLPAIRSLGGTVLKTSANQTRAKLIQSTLSAAPEGAANST
jgi:uncharacterized membrane protein